MESALDAGERALAARGERGEGAVGAVHVEPEVVSGADVGQGRQRVDRACVRGSGIRAHRQRQQAGGAVGGDCLLEHVHAQAERAVHGQHAHLPRAEAEGAGGAGD